MREIEFRVWDSRKKSYFNKKDIAIDNLGNIFVFEVCDDNDADLWHVRILSDPDNERYIIEENTGLTDINGTEIFEGDIIFQKPLSKNSVGWTGKVIFKEGAFMAEVYERGKIVMYLFLSEFNAEKTSEVIGDIHELNKEEK